LIEGYGLTETSPIVSFNPLDKPKIGTVGRPIPDVRVKINQPDQKGVGEILIQGDNVMKAYYKNPKATDQVFKNHWFYSGDLGFLDSAGYLHITGRKKELIILSAGKNISPEAVENHYQMASSYISELCVLAVNDQLVAVIVPNFDQFRREGNVNIHTTLKYDLESASKHYPSYKRITNFVISRANLPRTRLGKLKRHEIAHSYNVLSQQTLLSTQSTSPANLTEEELALIASPLWTIIIKTLLDVKEQPKPIRLTDHLELDLGLNSLNRIEIIATLEKQLPGKLPEAFNTKLFTVKDLIQELNQWQQKQKINLPTTHAEKMTWKQLLDTPPPKSMKKTLDRSADTLSYSFTLAVFHTTRILSKLLFRPTLLGIENLPRHQPFILCANHTSYIDAILLATTIPKWLREHIFFLGYRTYFEMPIIRTLVKATHIIPIDLNTQLTMALQACAYVLNKGYSLCLFPEGRRSIDGKLQSFKPGIGILAKELPHIPIVPAFIQGAYEAWPRARAFPRPHATQITFGTVQTVEQLKQKGQHYGYKNEYETITAGLRDVMIEMA
jgi:long-chain acyl-CoA synthetase